MGAGLRPWLPAGGDHHRSLPAWSGGRAERRDALRRVRGGADAVSGRSGAAPGPVVATERAHPRHRWSAGAAHQCRPDRGGLSFGSALAAGARHRSHSCALLHRHRAAEPAGAQTDAERKRPLRFRRAAVPGHRRHPHPGDPAVAGHRTGRQQRQLRAGSTACWWWPPSPASCWVVIT